LKIPYAPISHGGPIPKWASKIINEDDINKTCNKDTISGMITPDCIPKGIKNKILQLDIHSNENDLMNDPQFTEYMELVKRKNELNIIINTKPAGSNDVINAENELQKINKKLERLYGNHIVQIANSNNSTKIETFEITNPYVAMENRSKTNISFAKPGNSRILKKNSDIVNRLVPREITDMMTATNITNSDKSDTKKVVNKILTSLYYCGQSSSFGDPKCSPAQVLGEIREYQKWKEQQSQMDRKLTYPDIVNWKLIQTVVDSIKNAVAKPTPQGSSPHVPPIPIPPKSGQSQTHNTFGGPIGFPFGGPIGF
jgi:hypothetical protein